MDDEIYKIEDTETDFFYRRIDTIKEKSDTVEEELFDEENPVNQEIPISLIISKILEHFDNNEPEDMLDNLKFMYINLKPTEINYSDIFESSIIERFLFILTIDTKEDKLKEKIRSVTFHIIEKLLSFNDREFTDYFYEIGGVDRLLFFTLQPHFETITHCIQSLIYCISNSNKALYRSAICFPIQTLQTLLIPQKYLPETTSFLCTKLLSEIIKKYPKDLQNEALQEQQEETETEESNFFIELYQIIRDMVKSTEPDTQFAGLVLFDSFFHVDLRLWMNHFVEDMEFQHFLFVFCRCQTDYLKEKSLAIIFKCLKNDVVFPELPLNTFIESIAYESECVSDVPIVAALILDFLFSNNDTYINTAVEMGLFDNISSSFEEITSNSKPFLLKLVCTLIEHASNEILEAYLITEIHDEILGFLDSNLTTPELIIRAIDGNIKLFNLFGDSFKEKIEPFYSTFEEFTESENKEISEKAIELMNTIFPQDE